MSQWSSLDFFIFLLFFLNIILGMARGATKEITSMMCLTVAVIFTIKFTIPLTNFINHSPLIQDVIGAKMVQNFMHAIGAGPLTEEMLKEVGYCVALLINFVGIFCIGEAVFAVVGFNEVFSFPYATLNRKVGAVLGATRGYVLTIGLIIVLTHLFKTHPISDSYFFNLFRNTAARVDSIIIGQEVERYKEIYQDRNLYNVKDVYKIVAPEQEQLQAP